jgi:hypothetical protein
MSTSISASAMRIAGRSTSSTFLSPLNTSSNPKRDVCCMSLMRQSQALARPIRCAVFRSSVGSQGLPLTVLIYGISPGPSQPKTSRRNQQQLEQRIKLVLPLDAPEEIEHTALLGRRPRLADIAGELALEVTALHRYAAKAWNGVDLLRDHAAVLERCGNAVASTVRYLGSETDDAIEIAEKIDV